MKKKLLSLAVVLCMLVSLVVVPAYAASDDDREDFCIWGQCGDDLEMDYAEDAHKADYYDGVLPGGLVMMYGSGPMYNFNKAGELWENSWDFDDLEGWQEGAENELPEGVELDPNKHALTEETISGLSGEQIEAVKAVVNNRIAENLNAAIITVENIGDYAFAGTGIEVLEIASPEFGGPASIGENAFKDCDELKEIYYVGTPAEWEELLNNNTGDGNEALFPATVYYIDVENDIELESDFYSFANFDEATGTLTMLGIGPVPGVNIPKNIQKDYGPRYSHPLEAIKDQIKKVVIGDYITNVGYEYFTNCTNLEEVQIGKNVRYIGVSAFGECTSLTDVEMSSAENLEVIESGAFAGCTSLEEIDIPNSVTTIGTGVDVESSFDSINTIGGVFACCSNLKSIDLPDNLKSIDFATFSFCTE